DNLQMAVGTQIRAFDDRLFIQALMTNGNETQIANAQMDGKPGINVGGWFDFGGTWDPERKRWLLYGDSLADIDYSCNPVLRVGGAANLVPMDRRSLYSVAELSRPRALPGAPGGTNVINLFNGGGVSTATSAVNGAGIGPFAADAFDSYTFD